MEFLCMLLASILFDVIFCGVCGFTGRTILDAVRSERDRSAVVDKVGDTTQRGALKQADNDALVAVLIGFAFWCALGAGVYLLCII